LLELLQSVSLVWIWELDEGSRDFLRLSWLSYVMVFFFGMIVSNELEGTKLKIKPSLDITGSKQEGLSELQIIFVFGTNHQVDHHDSIFVHPLEVGRV
jgi:hypothetical protein